MPRTSPLDDQFHCNFSEGEMGQGALPGPRSGLGRVSVALQGAAIRSNRRRTTQVRIPRCSDTLTSC